MDGFLLIIKNDCKNVVKRQVVLWKLNFIIVDYF